MLETLIPRIRCAACKSALKAEIFHPGTDGHILDGVLTCVHCSAWYPIEDGVLSLTVPALRDPQRYRAFCLRFEAELQALELKPDAAVFDSGGDPAYTAQREQREHSDWFASNADLSYTDFAHTPFWRSVDAIAFRRWQALPAEGDWILDIGCANGRSTFQIARAGITVVGFDISEVMVRDAAQLARARGLHPWTSFLVADADSLPFHDDQFDAALTYGVVHHLPDPARACAEIHRALRVGGCFFACENNRSVLRPLFDWLMEKFPLWNEKAGAEPLISEGMVREWHAGLPVSIRLWWAVYLPPHVFNALGYRVAYRLMKSTNLLCGMIPGFRKAAGLIFWEIRKCARREGGDNPASQVGP